MVATSLQASPSFKIAMRAVCAGVAGWIAPFVLFLSMTVLMRKAPGMLGGSALVEWATPVTMALVSGFLIGAVLSLLFRRNARVVAIGAGVFQLVLLMSSGFYAEMLVVSLAIGAGLFLGALVARPQKRA